MHASDEKRFLTHLNSSFSSAETVKKHVKKTQKIVGQLIRFNSLMVANILKQAPLYLWFLGTTVMKMALSPCLLPTLPAICTSFHLDGGNPEKNCNLSQGTFTLQTKAHCNAKLGNVHPHRRYFGRKKDTTRTAQDKSRRYFFVFKIVL